MFQRRSNAGISIGRVLAVFLVALFAVLPAAAGAAPNATYAASGSGLVLGLDLLVTGPANPQGLTLAAAATDISSQPVANAKGAGRCEALAVGESIMSLPCTATNTQTAQALTDIQDPPQKCDSSLPAPLGDVLSLTTTCGDALAQVVGGNPKAEGRGEVSRVSLKLDLEPLLGDTVENTLEAVLNALDPVLDALPPNIKDALKSALEGNTNSLEVRLGSVISTSSVEGNLVKSRTDSSGAVIGILGIPICTTANDTTSCTLNPDPVTDGLIIIEVADAFAQATWDGSNAQAAAETKQAIARILIRDLTKPAERAYLAPIEVGPGSSQTTPATVPALLETTVSIGSPTTSVNNEARKGSASSSVSGVEVHALKGLGASSADAKDGGVRLRIASAAAAAQGEVPQVLGVSPPLPATGGERAYFYVIALLMVAGAPALYLAARRLSKA